MADIKLKASKRDILGKNNSSLRQKGVTPIHVFGHNVESLALECDTSNLKKVIGMAGTSRIIQIDVEKEKEPRSAFIHEIQKNAISGQILHVDFYQVNKKEKMSAEIPVVFTGESPASKSSGHIIEHLMTHLEVESFPDKMPPHIEVDISGLKEDGDAIHVKDINLGKDAAIITDPEQIIVKVSKLRGMEETEAEAPKEAEAEQTETGAETAKEEE